MNEIEVTLNGLLCGEDWTGGRAETGGAGASSPPSSPPMLTVVLNPGRPVPLAEGTALRGEEEGARLAAAVVRRWKVDEEGVEGTSSRVCNKEKRLNAKVRQNIKEPF